MIISRHSNLQINGYQDHKSLEKEQYISGKGLCVGHESRGYEIKLVAIKKPLTGHLEMAGMIGILLPSLSLHLFLFSFSTLPTFTISKKVSYLSSQSKARYILLIFY